MYDIQSNGNPIYEISAISEPKLLLYLNSVYDIVCSVRLTDNMVITGNIWKSVIKPRLTNKDIISVINTEIKNNIISIQYKEDLF